MNRRLADIRARMQSRQAMHDRVQVFEDCADDD